MIIKENINQSFFRFKKINIEGENFFDISIIALHLILCRDKSECFPGLQAFIINSIDEGYVKNFFEYIVFNRRCNAGNLILEIECIDRSNLTFSLELNNNVNNIKDLIFTNAYSPDAKVRLNKIGSLDEKWIAKEWPNLPSTTEEEYFMQTHHEGERLPRIGTPFHLKLWSEESLVLDLNIVHKNYKINVVFKDKNTLSLGKEDILIDTAYLFPDEQCAALVYRARFPVEDSDGDDIESIEIEEITTSLEESVSYANSGAAAVHPHLATLTVPMAEAVLSEQLTQEALELRNPHAAAAEATFEKPGEGAAQDAGDGAADLTSEVDAPETEALDVDLEELQAHTAALNAQADALLQEYGVTREEVARSLEQNPETAHLAKFLRAPVDGSEMMAEASLEALDADEDLPDVDLQELEKHTAALNAQADGLLQEYGLTREDIAQELSANPELAHLADFMRNSGSAANVAVSGLPAVAQANADALAESETLGDVDLAELEQHTQALNAQADALLQEYGLTRQEIAAELQKNPETAHLAGFLLEAPQRLAQEKQELQALIQQRLEAQNMLDSAESALAGDTQSLGNQKQELLAQSNQGLEAKNIPNLLADEPAWGTESQFMQKRELSAQAEQGLEVQNALDGYGFPAHEMGAEGAAFFNDAAEADTLAQGLGAVPLGAAGTAALTREQVQAMLEQQQPLAGCDLSGLDLSQLCFDGVDLSGVNAAQTNFNQCSLRGAKLDGALLQASSWVGADLSQASMQGCSASEAVFTQAVLTQANLCEADCSSANFDQAVLTQACASGAQFGKASMQGVEAAELKADKASFTEAQLAWANLQQANLQQADFSDALCERANLSQAQCVQAQFFGTKARSTTFQHADMTNSRAGLEADFSGAQLQHAKLVNANWAGVELAQANFEGAQLDDADFERSQAAQASFRLASAKQTRLSKMDLREADLTGVNLFRGSLRKSNLEHVKLHHSNLYGVDFEATQPTWASLEGANIKQTMLKFRPPVH